MTLMVSIDWLLVRACRYFVENTTRNLWLVGSLGWQWHIHKPASSSRPLGIILGLQPPLISTRTLTRTALKALDHAWHGVLLVVLLSIWVCSYGVDLAVLMSRSPAAPRIMKFSAEDNIIVIFSVSILIDTKTTDT